jgi:hypothetical protein
MSGSSEPIQVPKVPFSTYYQAALGPGHRKTSCGELYKQGMALLTGALAEQRLLNVPEYSQLQSFVKLMSESLTAAGGSASVEDKLLVVQLRAVTDLHQPRKLEKSDVETIFDRADKEDPFHGTREKAALVARNVIGVVENLCSGLAVLAKSKPVLLEEAFEVYEANMSSAGEYALRSQWAIEKILAQAEEKAEERIANKEEWGDVYSLTRSELAKVDERMRKLFKQYHMDYGKVDSAVEKWDLKEETFKWYRDHPGISWNDAAEKAMCLMAAKTLFKN